MPGSWLHLSSRFFGSLGAHDLDEAEALGAPLIVLVCGARPGLPLDEARHQIQAGIEAGILGALIAFMVSNAN